MEHQASNTQGGDGGTVHLEPSAENAFQSDFTSYNRKQKYLSINLADLKLRLRDFKNSVRNSDIIAPLTGVIGVWLPLFTSEFKGFLGLDPSTVKAIYSAVAILLSLLLIRNLFVLLRLVAFKVLLKLKKTGMTAEQLMKHEVDPDKLADALCNKSDEP
jgi:hypothetical protein